MADPTVTPSILSATPSYFASSHNYAAGTYRVSYTGSGAYRINPGAPWGVGYRDNDTQIDGAHGYYVTDGASNVARGPGNLIGYPTQAAAEIGNVGQYADYVHVGGAIGLYLNDGYYPDNVAGLPNPVFSLSALPVISFVATASNGPCGNYTLTWSVGPDSSLITSVSIDQGIGSVSTSGTTSVTLLTGSKTWTLTAQSTVGTVTAQVTISLATYSGGSTGPTIAPAISSAATTNFSSGANYPAGLYYVEYVSGAMGYNSIDQFWTINSPLSQANGYTITDSNGHTLRTSQGGAFLASQATVEAREAGTFDTYCHVGALPIGIAFFDNPTGDNKAGSPNPTWRLTGPSPSATLSASALSVVRGASVTLTYTAIGVSASIDHGVGSLFSTASNASGTVTVNPTSTTTYTLTSVADGFTSAVASVTITVLPPTVDSFSASASTICNGGSSTLTWATTGAATVSIDHGVGSVATSGSTSVSPTSTTTYIITATNASGTATSTVTVTVNALAPTPTFTLTAKGTRVVVSWTDPGAGYGTLTANVYRGSSSGGETLLRSGLAVADLAYTDSGLMSGSTYWYRVSFTNDCGEGTLAAEQSVTVVCCVGDWTASPAPASSSAASSAPASTFTASTAPTNTSTASTVPASTFVASTPPTPGGWSPSDCPG